MPSFITFAEPALSFSSVKEPYIASASEQTCGLKTFSEIEGQQTYSRRKDYFDHFFVAQVIIVRVFLSFLIT